MKKKISGDISDGLPYERATGTSLSVTVVNTGLHLIVTIKKNSQSTWAFQNFEYLLYLFRLNLRTQT